MIDYFFDHLSAISVIFFVFTFAAMIIIRLVRKIDLSLDRLVSDALTSALLPTGAALLVCSLYPGYMQKLEGLGINIAISGVVILFVAGKSTANSFRN